MSTAIVGTPPTPPETRPAFRRLRRGQVIRGVGTLALLLVVILAAFGGPLWQVLGTGILLLSVVIVVLLALGALVIALAIAAITRRSTRVMPWLDRSFRLLLVVGILLVGVASAVVGSQWHALTPPILGANGQPLPGSIASLEQVTLGSSQQWISIRGKNVHNPVLLFLAGGPGGSELTRTRIALAPLEDHFVVVNWDQPGAAKSYNAVPIASLTPERYVSDGHALVQLLRARFHQNKIYLMGESWGSILGIWLVQQYPALFSAFIGSGQMVNPTEDDILGYQFALTYAAEHGDSATVDTLRRNGPPPYVGDEMFWKYWAYLPILDKYMAEHEGTAVDSLFENALTAPEYGWMDKVNFFRGAMDVWSAFYPKLAHVNLTTQAARLDVPVYFLEGRFDVNAMTSLVVQYYRVLQAPHKELIWFEQSGHPSFIYEPDKVLDVMVHRVLAQTWPGR